MGVPEVMDSDSFQCRTSFYDLIVLLSDHVASHETRDKLKDLEFLCIWYKG